MGEAGIGVWVRMGSSSWVVAVFIAFLYAYVFRSKVVAGWMDGWMDG